jgi:hypothetical protein
MLKSRWLVWNKSDERSPCAFHIQERLTVDDERCPIKKDAGNFVRRWVEFLPGKEAVEYQAFIRQCTGLNGHSFVCQSQNRNGSRATYVESISHKECLRHPALERYSCYSSHLRIGTDISPRDMIMADAEVSSKVRLRTYL